jgi:hypothetical protein
MKKLVYLLILAFVVMLGCSREATNDENVFLKKKSDGFVQIPKKCWLATVPNYEAGTILCSPEIAGVEILAGGWMSGHETFGGKMITELSPWWVNGCEFDPDKMLVTQYNQGKHTMADGDYYFFDGVVTLDLRTTVCIAVVNCYGGVGRYEGATAEITLSGFYDFETNVATFNGEGWWNVPRPKN